MKDMDIDNHLGKMQTYTTKDVLEMIDYTDETERAIISDIINHYEATVKDCMKWNLIVSIPTIGTFSRNYIRRYMQRKLKDGIKAGVKDKGDVFKNKLKAWWQEGKLVNAAIMKEKEKIAKFRRADAKRFLNMVKDNGMGKGYAMFKYWTKMKPVEHDADFEVMLEDIEFNNNGYDAFRKRFNLG